MAKADLCFVGEVPTMNGGVSAVRFQCLSNPKQKDMMVKLIINLIAGHQ